MPFYANARDWGRKARARGFDVDTQPVAGSIAWSTSGTWGHVAYVQDVIGRRVHIEDYNHDGTGRNSSRVVFAAKLQGYIHFADRIVPPAPSPPPPGPAETPTPQPTASSAPTAAPVG